MISSEISSEEQEELSTLIRTHGGVIVNNDYESSDGYTVYTVSNLIIADSDGDRVRNGDRISVTSTWLVRSPLSSCSVIIIIIYLLQLVFGFILHFAHE